MEELFTTETEAASRALFVRLLATFAGSGIVWVIGTIRSDFYHRCGEVPGFSALKDGLGSYELLPPSGPEIAQIIREPARTAGLRFEESADRGRLEDVLQQAAAADPGMASCNSVCDLIQPSRELARWVEQYRADRYRWGTAADMVRSRRSCARHPRRPGSLRRPGAVTG